MLAGFFRKETSNGSGVPRERTSLELLSLAFENNCIKTNRDSPILLAAIMQFRDSSFWQGSIKFMQTFTWVLQKEGIK